MSIDEICWSPTLRVSVSHRHVGAGYTACGRRIPYYSAGDATEFGGVTCRQCLRLEPTSPEES